MPTEKQKRVAEAVAKKVGKGRKVSISKEMRKAGYSRSYSESPHRLTRSKGWEPLMEGYLPDDLLAETHGELVRAVKLSHYAFPKSEDKEFIEEVINNVPGCKLVKIRAVKGWKRAYYLTPDNQSRIRAIEAAYKLKGKFAPEKAQANDDPLRDLSDMELIGIRRELTRKLREQHRMPKSKRAEIERMEDRIREIDSDYGLWGQKPRKKGKKG